jgi:hypothetical protein
MLSSSVAMRYAGADPGGAMIDGPVRPGDSRDEFPTVGALR